MHTGRRRHGNGGRKSTAALAAALTLGTLGPAEAQEPDALRVVGIGVIAVDTGDRPVTDLTPEELHARIGDEPLDVAGVRPIRAPGPRPELPRVELHVDVGRNVATRTTAAARPRYWLLFIDVDNDGPAKRSEAADIIGGFIRESIPPSDFVAVMTYNGRIHLEQTFTDDVDDAAIAIKQAFDRTRTSGIPTHQRLRTAVARTEDCRFVPAFGEDPSDPATLGDAYSTTPGSEPVNIGCVSHQATAYIEEMRSRSDSYYRALESGVRMVSGLPAGPTVLAVSHGVTTRPRDEFLDVVRAAFGESQVGALESVLADDDSAKTAFDEVRALARREGVSLYFVDPSRRQSLVRSARQERLFRNQADPTGRAWAAPQADLQNLAEETGGFFEVDEDITPALARAVAREHARLVVDVYVPETVSPEDLADVRLTAQRDGVRLLGARADPAAMLPQDLRVPGGVQLGETRPRTGGGPGAVQTFLIGVRQSDMDYRREGSDMVADLTLQVRVETDDGQVLVESPHAFRHAYPVDKWEAAKNATLAVRGWLEAPPGTYRLFAEFRNPETRKTGRVEQDIRIGEAAQSGER